MDAFTEDDDYDIHDTHRADDPSIPIARSRESYSETVLNTPPSRNGYNEQTAPFAATTGEKIASNFLSS